MVDAELGANLIRLLDIREGHFLLESGHHGNLWLDLDAIFLRPRTIAPFTLALAGALARYEADAVCGPLTGGAFVAQMVAARLDLTFCYSERLVRTSGDGPYPVDYGIPDGFLAVIAGRRVAVIDDAINAGSAVGGTLRALRAAGATPVAVATLLDLDGTRSDPARFDGLPLVSLATLPAERWLPDACPLCAAQVPLELPGGD